jgi:amino acid transporter
MENKRIGLMSGITYTTIALIAAGVFLLLTSIGDYTWVARAGGTAWVFLLAMIILMPPVISYYKKKYRA